MATITVRDTDDAVSSMMALREALSFDLDITEKRIREIERSRSVKADAEAEESQILERARTALLSGLASVDEVLGWVHLMAEKDPEGNEPDSVRMLPYLHISLVS